jgi:hypothetical protein
MQFQMKTFLNEWVKPWLGLVSKHGVSAGTYFHFFLFVFFLSFYLSIFSLLLFVDELWLKGVFSFQSFAIAACSCWTLSLVSLGVFISFYLTYIIMVPIYLINKLLIAKKEKILELFNWGWISQENIMGMSREGREAYCSCLRSQSTRTNSDDQKN